MNINIVLPTVRSAIGVTDNVCPSVTLCTVESVAILKQKCQKK